MKIGIISDTHGLLRPEVIKALDGCEAILHGGDINRQEIIDRLEEIAPVYVVRACVFRGKKMELNDFYDTRSFDNSAEILLYTYSTLCTALHLIWMQARQYN